ncbi:hypothetical protein FRX31_031811 [Thalictrum thalictroides]|uniref:Uncharacterized protein n=1 Tax=Thalictrum thalictroides TaxID=46969 RepID=A0A7J6V2H9_THATH|nr:hypothetical protein FRX31_031811 [Thalictrum thalictroides]
MQGRWIRACKSLVFWKISHTFRKAKFSPDQAAKHAAGMMNGVDRGDGCIGEDHGLHQAYFRFS